MEQMGEINCEAETHCLSSGADISPSSYSIVLGRTWIKLKTQCSPQIHFPQLVSGGEEVWVGSWHHGSTSWSCVHRLWFLMKSPLEDGNMYERYFASLLWNESNRQLCLNGSCGCNHTNQLNIKFYKCNIDKSDRAGERVFRRVWLCQGSHTHGVSGEAYLLSMAPWHPLYTYMIELESGEFGDHVHEINPWRFCYIPRTIPERSSTLSC